MQIYWNDLFADDSNVFCAGETKSNYWNIDTNKLLINLYKTKYKAFSYYASIYLYKCENCDQQYSDEYSLGIYIFRFHNWP